MPHEHAGRERAKLVFVTGPSAAGKTTTARAWAESRTWPTAHIQRDLIGSLVRDGNRSAEQAASARGAHQEMVAKYFLSASVCAAMARRYLQSGIDVVLDSQRGIGGPPEWDGEWDEIDDLGPLFVVLLPRLEVALERNEQRRRSADRRLWMSQDDIRGVYQWDWRAWERVEGATILDTSTMTLEDTIAAIDDIVDAIGT